MKTLTKQQATAAVVKAARAVVQSDAPTPDALLTLRAALDALDALDAIDAITATPARLLWLGRGYAGQDDAGDDAGNDEQQETRD